MVLSMLRRKLATKSRASQRNLAIVFVLAIVLIVDLSGFTETDDRRLALSDKILRGWKKQEVFDPYENSNVIMFMSFPDAGSRFSLAAVEMATERTSATFYGKELVLMNGLTGVRKIAIPVFEDLPDGPFLTSDLEKPEEGTGLLTRTFCGGYCLSDCTCGEYNISPEDFMRSCLLAVTANTTITYLDPKIFSMAIILIRSPFDSIIGRFHYEHRLTHGKGDNKFFGDGWNGANFEKNGDGFRNWCAYVDNVNKNEREECFEDDLELLQLMEKVPCHSEFYKYVHWYNNAFISTKEKNTVTVHHEDFFYRPEGQVQEVVDFLNLTKTGETFDFQLRDYEYYYTPEEKTNILNLIEYMGSEDTLHNLRRYLLTPQL